MDDNVPDTVDVDTARMINVLQFRAGDHCVLMASNKPRLKLVSFSPTLGVGSLRISHRRSINGVNRSCTTPYMAPMPLAAAL